MDPNKLSSLLLQDDKVTEAQLQQAQTMRDATGGDLGDLLVKLGFLDPDTLANYRSKVEGVELVDISDMILPDTLVQSIPREVIEKHRMIPIAKDQNTITLAMSDAENFQAIEEVQFVTGMKVSTVIASKESITKAITRFFDAIDTAPEDAEEDAAVGVAADSPSSRLEMPTGEVSLAGLGIADWATPRYIRALVPLLFEKGIITEDELRQRAAEIEQGDGAGGEPAGAGAGADGAGANQEGEG